MRNPQFNNYNFTPGSHGHVSKYEDALDKLRSVYKINYKIGPTYNDVKFQKFNTLSFKEENEEKLFSILGSE